MSVSDVYCFRIEVWGAFINAWSSLLNNVTPILTMASNNQTQASVAAKKNIVIVCKE